MHVDHLRRARPFVQIVDVLGDERHLMRAGEVSQREMGGIGGGTQKVLAPGIIEIMDQRRVAGKALRCRDFFQIILRPEPADVTERAQPAFGGNARPCQYRDFHALRLFSQRMQWTMDRSAGQDGPTFALVVPRSRGRTAQATGKHRTRPCCGTIP